MEHQLQNQKTLENERHGKKGRLNYGIAHNV